MKKKLKIKYVSVFIMAVIFGLYIKPVSYNRELSDNPVETEAIGNDYEKFTADKILLKDPEEELKGAWGVLKLKPVIIEPTEDFIIEQTYFDDLYDMFESSSQWIFKDAGIEEIRSLFLKAGLDKTTGDVLLANTAPITDGKGFVTTPPDVVLWGLTAENRAKLYPLIGKYSDNIMYSQPSYYGSTNSDEWFYNSGMNKGLVEKLQKLAYVDEGITYISDMHLILPYLGSEEEKVKLLQLLNRTRTFDVRLEIEEGQDVSKIIDYWGRFGSKKLVEPMLERISNTMGGGEIDISRLLPEIPQSRLNTYSGLEELETDYKDCHWTTINFFNEKADESYYNVEDLLSVIKDISKPAENISPGFGDVVSIFDENNEFTHSCTYIADNLVLTKNGIGNLNPFVITYLDKTVPLYGNKAVYYYRTVGDTHMVDLE